MNINTKKKKKKKKKKCSGQLFFFKGKININDKYYLYDKMQDGKNKYKLDL